MELAEAEVSHLLGLAVHEPVHPGRRAAERDDDVVPVVEREGVSVELVVVEERDGRRDPHRDELRARLLAGL